MEEHLKVSIIVPCYNAIDKIHRCFKSLRQINFNINDFEVIFIDDCSTDGTFELLEKVCIIEKNWRLEYLSCNSGSPSMPRNKGINSANGSYLFFLDCDDEILPNAISETYERAYIKDIDTVRGYFLVNNGKKCISENKLERWDRSLLQNERIEYIIKNQSIGTPGLHLIKAKLLHDNDIYFPEYLKMGEDSLFATQVLCVAKTIEYIDKPLYLYHTSPSFTLSSTQQFGKKELNDHLIMWSKMQAILAIKNINYYKIRFIVSLSYIFSLLIFKNKRDIDEILFLKFANLIHENWGIIVNSELKNRYKDICHSLYVKNFNNFNNLCRPRLLIAGDDLKFIISAKNELKKNFNIKVDQWYAENQHDERQSLELLEWAEIVWCEWLLKNAVWFSHRVKPHQKLIIRMHRYELGRNYGEQLKIKNIDFIITVCVLFFERMLERFPNIPREKVRLIPCYVSIKYKTNFNKNHLFRLGMIGIIPSKKRFHFALKILIDLRKYDNRYTLDVFGKQAKELSWVKFDKSEMKYYQDCNEMIKNNNLINAISYQGYVSNIHNTLQMREIGFILSLSKSQNELPGFEAFQYIIY